MAKGMAKGYSRLSRISKFKNQFKRRTRVAKIQKTKAVSRKMFDRDDSVIFTRLGWQVTSLYSVIFTRLGWQVTPLYEDKSEMKKLQHVLFYQLIFK